MGLLKPDGTPVDNQNQGQEQLDPVRVIRTLGLLYEQIQVLQQQVMLQGFYVEYICQKINIVVDEKEFETYAHDQYMAIKKISEEAIRAKTVPPENDVNVEVLQDILDFKGTVDLNE